MLNKISLPVLVTVMCVLLAGVTGLAFLNRGYLTKILSKKNTNVGTTEVVVTRTDYSQTSRKILDWLDTQRNENGWYILERGCDVTAKTCNTVWDNSDGNKDGLIATWARFNFYNQTKDPKDLEIVKSDINKFYEKYPNGVDNALWICKITYDMWQSNLFDQDTKDKLEKICFNTQFPTPEEVEAYWNNITNKTANIDKTKKIWETWDGYALGIRDFDVNLSLATDMLYQYNWSGKQEYLDLAKKYFDEAKNVYKNNPKLGVDNVCLLGITGLDWYVYGVKEASDLDYVKDIYIKTVGVDYKKKDYQTTICGLMTQKLFEVTKENVYLAELNRNNLASISLNADNLYANDGSFFKNGMNGFSVKYKNIVENALIAESLRN